VGRPDERWGEIAVAFVRLVGDATLDAPSLVAHCRQRIAAQKTPSAWIQVTEWPLTGSGKIQKFVLRDRLVAGGYDPGAG
jgi:fatty-acyl-CoA synthase